MPRRIHADQDAEERVDDRHAHPPEVQQRLAGEAEDAAVRHVAVAGADLAVAQLGVRLLRAARPGRPDQARDEDGGADVGRAELRTVLGIGVVHRPEHLHLDVGARQVAEQEPADVAAGLLLRLREPAAAGERGRQPLPAGAFVEAVEKAEDQGRRDADHHRARREASQQEVTEAGREEHAAQHAEAAAVQAGPRQVAEREGGEEPEDQCAELGRRADGATRGSASRGARSAGTARPA